MSSATISSVTKSGEPKSPPQDNSLEPQDNSLELDVSLATCCESLPSEASMRSWIQSAIEFQTRQQQAKQEASISLRVVDDKEISEINHQFRHKDGATNVLSFPCELPEGIHDPLLGDIIISAETVIREAQQQQKPEVSHWAHLLIHGTLHLLGYDHIEDKEAQIMEQLESKILAQLGFPNPYESESQKTQATSHPLQPPSLG